MLRLGRRDFRGCGGSAVEREVLELACRPTKYRLKLSMPLLCRRDHARFASVGSAAVGGTGVCMD